VVSDRNFGTMRRSPKRKPITGSIEAAIADHDKRSRSVQGKLDFSPVPDPKHVTLGERIDVRASIFESDEEKVTTCHECGTNFLTSVEFDGPPNDRPASDLLRRAMFARAPHMSDEQRRIYMLAVNDLIDIENFLEKNSD
jgi:hypothetical protein